jgi:Flp pilus assembly protein TadD
MSKRGTIAIAAFAAILALSGCQGGAVDAMQTTSVAPMPAVPGAEDLASGKSHFRQANYGLAEKHFRKAVELNGASAEGWMGLAASYDQLGRFDFADRAYAQALKLAGRKPRLVSNMGYSYLLRGDSGKARELFLEARAGMSDTTLVDANLVLLDKG